MTDGVQVEHPDQLNRNSTFKSKLNIQSQNPAKGPGFGNRGETSVMCPELDPNGQDGVGLVDWTGGPDTGFAHRMPVSPRFGLFWAASAPKKKSKLVRVIYYYYFYSDPGPPGVPGHVPAAYQTCKTQPPH